MKFLILLSLPSCALALPAEKPFEIVESVPMETVYGSSQSARTADAWISMISSAKKSLDIETFYIISKPASLMGKVIAEIKQAAGRGVKVRIIIDSVFYRKMPQAADGLKLTPNIELKVIPFGKGIMHAKYFIADGEEVFLGSQNFDWRSIEHIHETGIRIKNKTLAQGFLRVFNSDWEGKTPSDNLNLADEVKIGGGVSAHIAISPKGSIKGFLWEIDEIVKAIKTARSEILISVMTYSLAGEKGGWREIDSALRQAGERGVKVKIIFADWAMGKKSSQAIKELSRSKNIELKISSIPQYSGGFIEYARVEHCKYMVVDGNLSIISTSNWEKNYFYQSRNVSLIIKGNKAAEILSDIFYKSWNGPYVRQVT
ncbi:MAG: phospholipase D-like domain-containing protein [Elusimicrobia bacterium]|nr:phospholipase D-like domain-containing protein [Elusimicrobiota bacterium]